MQGEVFYSTKIFRDNGLEGEKNKGIFEGGGIDEGENWCLDDVIQQYNREFLGYRILKGRSFLGYFIILEFVLFVVSRFGV